MRLLMMTVLLIWGGAFAVADEAGDIEALLVAAVPDASDPGAVVVAMRDGEVVYIGGRGSAELGSGRVVTPDTPFRIASVSKMFTAMAVMMLAEEGKLSFDDPVTTHVSDFPAYGDGITIRQLLHHTSGLEAYEHEVPDEYPGFVLDRDVLDILKKFEGTKFAPGSEFQYSNAGYALLTVIVEEVSGQRYDVFMRERVFAPLGMTSTVVVRDALESVPDRAIGYRMERRKYMEFDTTPTSLVMGDGGIYSTARDFAKWEKGLREYALVSREMMEQAYTGSAQNPGYGFGWENEMVGGVRQVGHSGNSAGFAADYRRVPEKGLAVAVFMNRRSFTGAVDLVADVLGVLGELGVE